MSRSIKKNVIFNLINTVSALLFPLITFPYASRVILADGIGQVQFFNSIITYITLLTSIGIPLYGVKEIARVRDNEEELSKTTVELVSLSFLMSLLGYIIVAVLCVTVGRIQDNIPLFLILSSSILITAIGCPWFYNGVEDFKYITILNLIVKTASVVFLYCFVKTRDDLLLYGVYAVFGSIGNYLVNFLRLKKYIRCKDLSLKTINCWRHIKPASAVFLFNIITSIYINLDTVMLGFLSNSTAVGFYTGASKISHLLVTLVTSLGVVLLPRSANLIKNGKIKEFYELSTKSYNFITMVSFPILGGVLLLSHNFIYIICGAEFIPAVQTLRIISPIIVFIGISNVLGLQMLYPLGKIKMVTLSTCVGAAVNVLLNFALIPLWSHNGAAIATLVAEFSVTIVQLYIVKSFLSFPLFSKKTLHYILSTLFMVGVCYMLMLRLNGALAQIIVIPIIGGIIYCTLMFLFREGIVVDMIGQIKEKVSKRNG